MKTTNHDDSPRRLIVSHRLSHEARVKGESVGAEDLLAILPNRQAARSLAVPYRSLEGLAARIVERDGLHVASKLVARRLLARAVATRGGSDDPAGLARAVESTLRELLRAGVDDEALRAMPNGRLNRLGDIAAAYRRLLRKEGLIDAAELLWRAAERATARAPLHVSGFPRLPAAEREFLDAVAAAGSVVQLPVADGSLFEENREAVTELRARGWRVEAADEASTGLGDRLARRFLSGTASGSLGDDPGVNRISVLAYPDVDAEARGTLAAVKALLTSGTTADRIAVVARNEEAYGPTLLAVADEFGVPLRALYRVPLAETRFGHWIASLLEVTATDFPFEETARLLSHPLAAALDPDGWREVRESRLSGAEGWRRFLPALAEAWPQSAPREDFARRLLRLLDTLGIRKNALHWPREAVSFHTFTEELRALPEPQREIAFDTFAGEVTELAAVLTVPTRPGRGGVELHTPLSLFGAQFDHLFVLGAAEGTLPSPIRPDPLLDPFEREELQTAGQRVESVSSAARREELSFWALLQSVTSRLTIGYPRLVGRSETLPSPFLARLGLVPEKPSPRPVCSPAELRRASLPFTDDSDPETEDLVLANARHAHRVEAGRESEAPHDAYDGIAGLPYRPPPNGLGVSRFIDLASCPFKFFAASVLYLQQPEEGPEDLDASLRGRLYHLVLQLALERARGRQDPREAALAALDEAFAEAETELDLTSLPTWNLEREGHLITVRRAIEGEGFIREGALVRELETEFEANWRGLPVRGRVDRIDTLDEGLALVDYKSGGSVSNLAKDAQGKASVDLQLAIYREAAADELAPGDPVSEALYYSVVKGRPLSVTAASEEELHRISSQARAAWREGAYPVEPDLQGKACKYCDFDALCRTGPRLERKRNRS